MSLEIARNPRTRVVPHHWRARPRRAILLFKVQYVINGYHTQAMPHLAHCHIQSATDELLVLELLSEPRDPTFQFFPGLVARLQLSLEVLDLGVQLLSFHDYVPASKAETVVVSSPTSFGVTQGLLELSDLTSVGFSLSQFLSQLLDLSDLFFLLVVQSL